MITVNDVLDNGYIVEPMSGSLFGVNNKKLSDKNGGNVLVINGDRVYIPRNLLVYYYSINEYTANLDRELAKTILFLDGNKQNTSASNLIHVDTYLLNNKFIEHPTINGLYANASGKVFSYHTCTELGSTNSYGYRVSKFKGKIYQTHRVVYECVSGTLIPDDMTIHHIDANKLNNNYENLSVISRADNTIESNIRNRENRLGEKHPGSKLTEEMVIDI